MKLNTKIVCFLLTIFTRISTVRAGGNCTDNYLRDLGMIFEDEATTKPKVFKTSSIMTETATSLVMRVGASREQYRDVLINKLVEAGLYKGERECVECFSNSVKCIVKNCKGVCTPDPCKRACIKCVDKHCKQELLDCVGKGQIVNPCDWAKEFEQYKTSRKTAKAGGASGSG